MATLAAVDKNVRAPSGEGARDVSGVAPDTAREARALPAGDVLTGFCEKFAKNKYS